MSAEAMKKFNERLKKNYGEGRFPVANDQISYELVFDFLKKYGCQIKAAEIGAYYITNSCTMKDVAKKFGLDSQARVRYYEATVEFYLMRNIPNDKPFWIN